MKKSLKTILAASLMAVSLASCGSVSAKYATKINDAAKTESTKDDFTFKKVCSDLGKDFKGVVVNEKSGVATWTDKKGNTIVVTFADGYAIGAVYSEKKQESK